MENENRRKDMKLSTTDLLALNMMAEKLVESKVYDKKFLTDVLADIMIGQSDK